MFVNEGPVPVSDGPNTILIKPKMDFVTKSAVMDALQGLRVTKEAGATAELHYGAYQVALLRQNVVGWSGPAFVGFACTPENIGRLDPDEPLVAKVLDEIAARNPAGKRSDEEKKVPTSDTAPPSEESV